MIEIALLRADGIYYQNRKGGGRGREGRKWYLMHCAYLQAEHCFRSATCGRGITCTALMVGRFIYKVGFQ
jgi:hypothetical protein